MADDIEIVSVVSQIRGLQIGPNTPTKRDTGSVDNGLSPSPSHSPRRSLEPGQCRLSVKRIIGTTATSHANFCLVGNAIAYTAGAGAVVANLDPQKNDITAQRFLCTSSRKVQSIQASSSSNLWLPEPPSSHNTTSSPSRDSNGYLLPSVLPNTTGSGTFIVPGVNSFQDDSSQSSHQSPSRPPAVSSTPSAKDKIKTTSAVTLSSDGTLCAVGETGHQPKVFVYSLAPDASSIPLAILSEHRFGVKLLAFSPCGKYLASLGNTNDGFLHIWYISMREGIAQLHSSNRCISFINDMKWIGSSKLVTVGVRHVRVWHVETEPNGSRQSRPRSAEIKPNVLSGRNFVLQDFSRSTFKAIAPLSANVALVATDRGEIATIHDTDDEKKLPVFTPKFGVGFDSATLDVIPDSGSVVIGGGDDQVLTMGLEQILSAEPLKTVLPPLTGASVGSANLFSNVSSPTLRSIYAWTNGKAVGLDSHKNMTVFNIEDPKAQDKGTPGSRLARVSLVSSQAPELRGIRPIHGNRERFLTWSSDGIVSIWSSSGERLLLKRVDIPEEGSDAELTVACVGSYDRELLTVGTTTGNIYVIDLTGQSEPTVFSAHGSSVTWIDYYTPAMISGTNSQINDHDMIVSSSRDRTLQIFVRTDEEWSLHQTLNCHKGSVQSVRITNNGQRIISCSADRTVQIHKLATNADDGSFVFLHEKTISLKTAPMDMQLDYESDNIVVSSDKHILKYKIPSGELQSTYRTVDNWFDAVNLSSTSLGTYDGTSSMLLAGMGQDKGIRVYDHRGGTLLSSEWGHSEGVAGITWLQRFCDGEVEQVIVSGGNDGCIFLWEFESGAVHNRPGSSMLKVSPTRKVLTKSELSKFYPLPPQSSSPYSKRSPSPAPPPSQSTTPRPSSRRTSVLPSPVQRKRTVTPSKSVSDFRSQVSRNNTVIPLDSPSPPKRAPSRLDDATDDDREGSISPPKGSSPKSTSTDAICIQLRQFRDNYRRRHSQFDQTRVERLKNELKQTLRLLDGSIGERSKVNELLETLGDRLIDIVSAKINNDPTTT